ncbi:N-acetylmuramoyl-L-alanine amidase [Pseudooceanicola sp.]|uniref:N-acetylmuramoyl-L-alanine amidase n=1 Tax=Pseudooceanicola sp. TaxID=1914328 RepID=UPI002604F5BA|nr:N-acetylmuramoyl-L-alanine amidase [Pseudooceanicola sp.]MDF1854639.1 N-acetylmuramoyl-L-alanine amidase [Pseudooceanicola sp.]
MSRLIHHILGALVLALATTAPLSGQERDFTALARVDMSQSQITDAGAGLSVELTLSQGVPWRAFTLTDPPRAVFDFREVDWTGVDKRALLNADRATDLRFGVFRPGWSRLVLDLAGPLALDRTGMSIAEDSGRARLTARFLPATVADFAAVSGAPPDGPGWAMAQDGSKAPPKGRSGPLVVVIDAGHGGIDPGAEREGLVEKDLMLALAREMSETLIRAGGIEVVLTRNDDSFVSLERRVEIAHEVGAHVFLSLHADALAEGRARGAVVHTLSDTATDAASAKLAERHDRDDILSGIDLSGKADEVADVLLDLARLETRPRTDRLADALVAALRAAGAPLNSHAQRSAGFSVLKAADIPSVLIEVGFLSDKRDRANLNDPAFRARVAGAVRDALAVWLREDAALAPLVRQ